MKNKPQVTSIECVRPDWIRVVNKARRTRGLKPICHEPSEGFKRKILLAEHSPIRLLEYDFTVENVRQWVTTHLVRHHEGCEKFVHSQRQDINTSIVHKVSKIMEALADVAPDGWKERDYLPQGTANDLDMTCNAQAFINISRKRLCYGCPSPETREVWEMVIEMLRDIDPILAEKCVPECVYRGFCPEADRCCGYVRSREYKRRLEEYRKF